MLVVVGVALARDQGLAGATGPWLAALLCAGAAIAMIRSSIVTKPALWQERLDGLGLRGNERALDVGCGRGLVTVALAQRLSRGSVVGVDVWRRRDQTGNSQAAAEHNLRVAGVDDRAEIIEASATDLPFADGEFEVVTASLALHTIPVAAGRRDAMHELMRVTAPGGQIVIVDSGRTVEFEAWLRDGDWDECHRTLPTLRCYPAVRIVTATKPGRRPTTSRRPR